MSTSNLAITYFGLIITYHSLSNTIYFPTTIIYICMPWYYIHMYVKSTFVRRWTTTYFIRILNLRTYADKLPHKLFKIRVRVRVRVTRARARSRSRARARARARFLIYFPTNTIYVYMSRTIFKPSLNQCLCIKVVRTMGANNIFFWQLKKFTTPQT